MSRCCTSYRKQLLPITQVTLGAELGVSNFSERDEEGGKLPYARITLEMSTCGKSRITLYYIEYLLGWGLDTGPTTPAVEFLEGTGENNVK